MQSYRKFLTVLGSLYSLKQEPEASRMDSNMSRRNVFPFDSSQKMLSSNNSTSDMGLRTSISLLSVHPLSVGWNLFIDCLLFGASNFSLITEVAESKRSQSRSNRRALSLKLSVSLTSGLHPGNNRMQKVKPEEKF